nr:E3 SUMO-protein ligase NSE2-like [Megalopta genalis]
MQIFKSINFQSPIFKMTQSQQTIEELHDSYTQTAANIISYFGGNEVKEKLKELRDIVENNCVLGKKLRSVEDTKNHLFNLYNDENAQSDLETIIQEYKNSISEINTDVSDNSKLIDYDNHVKALLDEIGDKEEEENDDEDVDMMLTGGLINVIDPISKKRIVDPVKNIVCGHTYDRETITELLKINEKTRCPVVGCKTTDFVKLKDLRLDIVTKMYLDKNPA